MVCLVTTIAHVLHNSVRKQDCICVHSRYLWVCLGIFLQFVVWLLWSLRSHIKILQHYTELTDIKRIIINTHAIEPQVPSFINIFDKPFIFIRFYKKVQIFTCSVYWQALVEFFGTLSKDWALDCMKELLLVNMRGNLQIIVQAS